jgi:hypothetical protein
MFPDYPRAKARFLRLYLLWVEGQKYQAEPILRYVTRYRQHEGELENPTEYSHVSFMSRDDIRTGNMSRLYEVGAELAKAMAGQQVRRMIDDITAVAPTVPVSGGEITKEVFLEMISSILTDFHPETLEPQVQLLGSSEGIRSLLIKATEWQSDPDFRARLEAITNSQLEQWRDRESRRALVD